MANLLEVLGVRPEELKEGGTGGWRNVEPLPQGRLVSDTNGPFPQNQRFADPVRNYDALFRNVERGERVETPRTQVLAPAAAIPPPRKGIEELLRAAYGTAMTPLPMPPPLDVNGLMQKLRAARAALPNIPDIPELPKAPEWMLQYSRDRGLMPEQRLPVPPPGR